MFSQFDWLILGHAWPRRAYSDKKRFSKDKLAGQAKQKDRKSFY
jgi:hypothetical protein